MGGIVFGVTAFGAMCWKVQGTRLGNAKTLKPLLDSEGSPGWRFVPVTDDSEWGVTKIKLLNPIRTRRATA